MSNDRRRILLVGDNPFQGISHLSQERARLRGNAINQIEYAAKLVMTSVDNGADGFMFSVSDKTLSIIKRLREKGLIERLRLYALVPYAYEYVRLAAQLGGIPRLAKKLAKQIIFSGNVRAIETGFKGVIRTDPIALVKAYLFYEISRIKSSAGEKANLECMLLHEIITDMALALNLDWLFKSYEDLMLELGIKPGFETRNFAYLVNKLREWGIDFGEIIIATPFNKLGFQMNPSRTECEEALASLPEPNVIAMSILGAGYLKLPEAIDYIWSLSKLKGVVVGVSKEQHARETFKLLLASWNNRH